MPLFYFSALAGALLAIELNELLEAQKPSSPQKPWVPPFGGGQCDTSYRVTIAINIVRQDTKAIVSSSEQERVISGRIRGLRIKNQSPPQDYSFGVFLQYGENSEIELTSGSSGVIFVVSAAILSAYRLDGLPDNCGNLPNPNPVTPIAESGYGIAPENISGNSYEPSLLYAPIIPGGGAIIAAEAALAIAAAAIAAAATIAELAAAIAEFFEKEAELEKEKEKEEEKEKEKEKKKEIWRQRLGTIRNDGILSLIPRDTNESIKLLYLEINFVNIPNTIGKYFGEYSPNRYPYGYGLGYIGFYGAGAGIRETHNMEFRRNSISIPADTMGFIYHLGLNTSTTANVDLVYEREVSA